MITLGSRCSFDTSSVAVVYLLGGEVATPHFYLAKRKVVHKGGNSKEVNVSSKWNGYGGLWVPSDKNIHTTAVRKLYEKAGGVKVLKKDLMLGGRVQIFYPGNTTGERDREIFFFTTYLHSKDPEETKKMSKPKLFSVYETPYKEMRPADEIIIPILMSGRTVVGKIHLDLDTQGKRILKSKDIIVAYPS